MRETVRITRGMREEILRLYQAYDRAEVTPVVRVLTAIENGRVHRGGSQELALSPEERLDLTSILDYCMEEWRCGLDYSRSIGEYRTRQRLLEQAESLAEDLCRNRTPALHGHRFTESGRYYAHAHPGIDVPAHDHIDPHDPDGPLSLGKRARSR